MGNFFAELKRRHIYRVAAAYAVVAWVLIQLVNNITPMLNLPASVGTVVLVLLAVGFPVVLLFAWVQHLASDDGAAARAATGMLDWALIGALVVVIALVSYQQLTPATDASAARQQTSIATGAANPAGISIAVLPFANLSGDANQEFFSDGMTEEITIALANVQSLKVIGRSSAFQFKGQNRDLRAVGQALGASHLIEGSVRKVGDRVRISAELIKADDGVNLWSQNYDRQLTDIFAIQDDIAQAIAVALRVPLGLAQGDTLVRDRTNDLASYEQYLRARTVYRGGRGDEAIAILEPLVARDSRFAPGWALLALVYGREISRNSALRSASIEDARRIAQSFQIKAETAARKAIELDSRNAVGYSALARVQQTRGNWSAAEDLYRQALALDPNDPDTLQSYGGMLDWVGRLKEELSIAERARALEPTISTYKLGVVIAMQHNGQIAASIPVLEGMPPEADLSYVRNSRLAHAYAAVGRFAEAADTLLLIMGDEVSRHSVEDAARLLRQAPTKVSAPKTLPTLEGGLSFVYTYIGAPDRIFEYPERDLEIKSVPGGVLWHPDYAVLRKTERFKAYVRKGGLPAYWRARGWPDLCRPTTGDDFECN